VTGGPSVPPDPGAPVAGEASEPVAGEASEPVAAEPSQPALPPDPAAYDSPRAVQARRRGLDAPYIAGGRDPQPERANREERFYLRLLLIMVVVIVLSGFVLGFIAAWLNQG
jgi:hypothetical protein